jgi:hypothetical protein
MIPRTKTQWAITGLFFLPLLILLVPKAIVLNAEPGEYIPWYTKYTSIPWLLTMLYVYPPTFITLRCGFALFGPVHVVFVLVYLTVVSLVLRYIFWDGLVNVIGGDITP